jgi:hypothetical protein
METKNWIILSNEDVVRASDCPLTVWMEVRTSATADRTESGIPRKEVARATAVHTAIKAMMSISESRFDARGYLAMFVMQIPRRLPLRPRRTKRINRGAGPLALTNQRGFSGI